MFPHWEETQNNPVTSGLTAGLDSTWVRPYAVSRDVVAVFIPASSGIKVSVGCRVPLKPGWMVGFDRFVSLCGSTMSDLNWVTMSTLLRSIPTAGLHIHTGLHVYARKNQEIWAKGNKWFIKRDSGGVSGSRGLESTVKPVPLLWSRNNFVPCPSMFSPPTGLLPQLDLCPPSLPVCLHRYSTCQRFVSLIHNCVPILNVSHDAPN